jgi:hypothetical protein
MVQMTSKATEEIEKIRKEIEQIKAARTTLENARRAATNWYEQKALGKETDRMMNKIYGRDEKIREIENTGFSTREVTAITKESEYGNGFIVVSNERGLGYRAVGKIGFSKTADSYVEVHIHRFTDFMRNVQGCASLAGKRQVNALRRLTKDEYDARIAAGRTTTSSFLGPDKIVTTPITPPEER